MQTLFYCLDCYGRLCSAKVPFIEGVVQSASAENYKADDKALHYMIIKLDNFEKGHFFIHNAGYRIDRGEKVRLYYAPGFEKPNQDGSINIDGVQILDEQGEVKFQSTHAPNVKFK